ncbi:hypothetical protein F9K97_17975 [Brucella anthropi]|uniref:hypothetical protein n=1 Tax=Brucella anthropi TaxID=529 RepID=UPI00124BF655|nr:hypothetical protein [Brucella anthropi]KAB2784492.1 hypothetical protein F9K97_17975 [Brucella anthropi]
MSFDNNYFSADHNEYTAKPLTKAGRGILRVVLLFGSAVVALALIIVPVLNDQANKVAAQSVLPVGIDRTMTGSIKRDASAQPHAAGQAYTVRKSVLQPSPNSVCIIETNGSHHGDC